MKKFNLEISITGDMVSADDFAGALERAAVKIREGGNDALYLEGQTEQVRDENGVTVGEWSIGDGLRTSETIRELKAEAAKLVRQVRELEDRA